MRNECQFVTSYWFADNIRDSGTGALAMNDFEAVVANENEIYLTH